ncbi:hypothetical protein [Streptomyces laurentii]|uniref:hypothetical protein n=1 Tax=Streptomyces laurentii TaxID=39478 RepID=UPI00368CCB2E
MSQATHQGPYDWAADDAFNQQQQAQVRAPRQARTVPPRPQTPPQAAQPQRLIPVDPSRPGADQLHWDPAQPQPQAGPSRAANVAEAAGAAVGAAAGAFVGQGAQALIPPVHVHLGGGNGGNGGGGGKGAAAAGGSADRHQGDRMIYAIERIEIRNEKDILALAKAINHLGRELHLILGMRAEEINGVLSQYKGKWFHFGATNRVKARLVSAHLKVSAEAAKALGVGALKMSHAFHRHFVEPELEAKRARGEQKKPPRRSFSIGEDL